jgi:hypothetical protein
MAFGATQIVMDHTDPLTGVPASDIRIMLRRVLLRISAPKERRKI